MPAIQNGLAVRGAFLCYRCISQPWLRSSRFTSQGESIFIGTNATEAQDSFVDGALFVDVNPDPTESLLLLELDVSASDPELVQRIHVCVTHSPHRGIVIYVRWSS